jgi:CRISPR/Cas system-associated exonuclease Cas4 (RecB family)
MPLLSINDLLAPDALDRIEEAKELGALYHEYLSDLKDGSVRHPGIHASEISKCYRQAVYTMKGEPKVFDSSDSVETRAYWKKVLDHGTWLHDMVQTHFHDMARNSNQRITFQSEVKLHPSAQPLAARWNIHSSCDGLFTFHVRNPTTWRFDPVLRVGLEIKSSKDSEFSKLKEPKPEHIEQVHVYMAVLDVPLFWVMYFNKDNQNITPATPPWLVRFDRRLWERLEQRFANWEEHIAKGTLPDPMPGPHCSFCGYKTVCNPPERKVFTLKTPGPIRGRQ